jgi:hypothetical protein
MSFNTGLLDQTKLQEWRRRVKLEKFTMRLDTKDYETDLVKRNVVITTGGLDRPGMMATAKNTFQIDVPYMLKYRRAIKQNLVKSIKTMVEKKQITTVFFKDEASYLEIAELCLVEYADGSKIYNSEYNVQDQRGRAIKAVLKRIGNYISSKDFRALLKVPRSAGAIAVHKENDNALNDIYYFIAELTGNKCIGLTEADKIRAGKLAYTNRVLPRLDLKSTEGRDELHELIWLERIYDKLDRLNKIGVVLWDIPLEIDHSMSLAQIVGALTNDKRVLESTCVIGDKLSDPWFINGVKRITAKTVGTPVFYGSSKSAVALVKGKKLLRTQNLPETATEKEIEEAKRLDKLELALLKKEFATGRFSILKQFKDLLIQNYGIHTPVVHIDLGITNFEIHTNKWKPAGTTLVCTEVFDGKKWVRVFTHKVNYIPDYDKMKTFWATCLVHHLDSDLMEHNLVHNSQYWALDIHDAILCLPGQARIFRESASRRLKYYNTNRKLILNSYMISIGAITDKAYNQLLKLLASVVEAEDLEFSRNCMK